jgi:hypothetical protein
MFHKVTIFVCLLLLSGQVFADNYSGIELRTVERIIDGVILVINKANPNHIIVVTSDGRWLADVKEVQIVIRVGHDTRPQAICSLYKGPFKPTKPVTYSWAIKEIMMISPDEFQAVIDGLSEGKFNLPAR